MAQRRNTRWLWIAVLAVLTLFIFSRSLMNGERSM